MKASILYISLFYNMLANSLFAQNLDIQGHRGARGLYPENTTEGMLIALNYGVTTLEMDVVVTADKQVILSHEPFFSPEICTQPNGSQIPEASQHQYNIYMLTYEDVLKFDCGLKNHPRFPEQKKVAATKPLLSNVIDKVEAHITVNNLKAVNYNIEIKSTPQEDGVFHPQYGEFSDLVYQQIMVLPVERIIIQSFDIRVLQYWKRKYPNYKLALLIEDERNISANIALLGFEPDIYSPYFKLLNRRRIKKLQNRDIQVIPWTVNDVSDMQKMVDWGVDGIITDYPNRVSSIR